MGMLGKLSRTAFNSLLRTFTQITSRFTARALYGSMNLDPGRILVSLEAEAGEESRTAVHQETEYGSVPGLFRWERAMQFKGGA